MIDDEMRADLIDVVRETINNMGIAERESEDEEPETEPIDVNELRKELYGGGRKLSNREYIEKTLALRDAIIESGKDDPFLPHGHGYLASSETRNAAKQAAEGLKHCLDVANGSDEYFDAELARIMRDTSPITARKA